MNQGLQKYMFYLNNDGKRKHLKYHLGLGDCKGFVKDFYS